MAKLDDLGPGYTYNNWLSDASAASTTLTTFKNNEATARTNRINQGKTDLANGKAANHATKLAKDTAAYVALHYALGTADANILIAYLNGGVTYVTAIKGLQTAYGTSIDNAADTYIKAVINATDKYENEYCRLTGRYYDAVKQINLGYGIDASFYGNGATSTDVQVCFAAGTPILLADETHKPIETIQPGDVVLAKDHNDPTGAMKKCKVVRVFKNEPQSLWKLTTDDDLTVFATQEHPFFVIGKGWVQVRNLQVGDRFLRADSSHATLTHKEYIEEKEPVYNFEVEEAHTYFVGESLEQSVLVHNFCAPPSYLVVDITSSAATASDRFLHNTVDGIVTQMENTNWTPSNPKDPGAFGKEVDLRTRQALQGKPGWYTDVYVERGTNKVLSVGSVPNVKSDTYTQVDAIKMAPGKSILKNSVLMGSDIEGIYDIKTGTTGAVGADQRQRLSNILNFKRVPNAQQSVKSIVPSKTFRTKTASGVPGFVQLRGATELRKLTNFLAITAGAAAETDALDKMMVWAADVKSGNFERDLEALLGNLQVNQNSPAISQNEKDAQAVNIISDFVKKRMPSSMGSDAFFYGWFFWELGKK